MLNDTFGTAVVMFMVARHFETAVITSGHDITSLMRVRPPPQAHADLPTFPAVVKPCPPAPAGAAAAAHQAGQTGPTS